MRTVAASRYVTPLREGGSLPAIVEADDDGLYVLKFRGAGQGPKALIAEVIAGELARVAGLNVPEIVRMTLDVELARTEPDPEIQELIRASAGLNLGLDYLPGSITFDPLMQLPGAPVPDAMLASQIVWFDACMTNIDRTARNTNLLVWHRQLWLIDHGAALYFHHAWERGVDIGALAAKPFAMIRDHALLPMASELEQADALLTQRLTAAEIDRVVDLVPDEWLLAAQPDLPPPLHRRDYSQYLQQRVAASPIFTQEALRARAAHL
ncbi:aminotransferase class I and II [soil metagenome]